MNLCSDCLFINEYLEANEDVDTALEHRAAYQLNRALIDYVIYRFIKISPEPQSN